MFKPTCLLTVWGVVLFSATLSATAQEEPVDVTQLTLSEYIQYYDAVETEQRGVLSEDAWSRYLNDPANWPEAEFSQRLNLLSKVIGYEVGAGMATDEARQRWADAAEAILEAMLSNPSLLESISKDQMLALPRITWEAQNSRAQYQKIISKWFIHNTSWTTLDLPEFMQVLTTAGSIESLPDDQAKEALAAHSWSTFLSDPTDWSPDSARGRANLYRAVKTRIAEADRQQLAEAFVARLESGASGFKPSKTQDVGLVRLLLQIDLDLTKARGVAAMNQWGNADDSWRSVGDQQLLSLTDAFDWMPSFSVRWTGFVTPSSTGSYRWATSTNTPIKVWVDDQLVLDSAQSQEGAAAILLEAGQPYTLVVEGIQDNWSGFVRLMWQLDDEMLAPIPIDVLTHQVAEDQVSNGLWVEYFGGTDFSESLGKTVTNQIELELERFAPLKPSENTIRAAMITHYWTTYAMDPAYWQADANVLGNRFRAITRVRNDVSEADRQAVAQIFLSNQQMLLGMRPDLFRALASMAPGDGALVRAWASQNDTAYFDELVAGGAVSLQPSSLYGYGATAFGWSGDIARAAELDLSDPTALLSGLTLDGGRVNLVYGAVASQAFKQAGRGEEWEALIRDHILASQPSGDVSARWLLLLAYAYELNQRVTPTLGAEGVLADAVAAASSPDIRREAIDWLIARYHAKHRYDVALQLISSIEAQYNDQPDAERRFKQWQIVLRRDRDTTQLTYLNNRTNHIKQIHDERPHLEALKRHAEARGRTAVVEMLTARIDAPKSAEEEARDKTLDEAATQSSSLNALVHQRAMLEMQLAEFNEPLDPAARAEIETEHNELSQQIAAEIANLQDKLEQY